MEKPVLKRTKIIATLGPSTDRPGELEALIDAGVDLVRLNFSHGAASDHEARVKRVQEYANKVNRIIGVIGDLQGPKIRISRFKTDKVVLKNAASFILNAALDEHSGTSEEVGIDYKELINDVAPGDILLLDDGRIILEVTSIESTKIITTVIVGGILSNNKGINRQGGGLSAGFLTEKDLKDLKPHQIIVLRMKFLKCYF